MSTTDYSREFDVDTYLSLKYAPGNIQKMHDFSVQKLHEHFKSQADAASTGVEFRVLDYGCGPVIANIISAARVASEIVLAEYTEQGRAAVRSWLNNNPNSFNWSPFHKYVVQELEGGSAEAAEEREKRLRSIVKAVVECDVTQDPPIKDGYQGPYDAVISCLCLTTACKTKEEFVRALHKISTLVKPGGCLLFSTVEPKDTISGTRCYPIGDKTYTAVEVERTLMESTLRNDFQEITVKQLPADAKMAQTGIRNILFFTAWKNK